MMRFVLLLLMTSCATTGSVKPGINDSFLAQHSVQAWQGRFEVESREIWTEREHIVDAIGVFRGADVADVGAGTGFIARMLADRVGALGRVYAVDLMGYFVAHIRDTARANGRNNLVAVQCTERSIALPQHSVDVIFTCNTYHHFEYPAQSLASIWSALRPGGRLVVVDFIRIPGVSRPFVIGHVRAGEEVVTREIEEAGFEKVGENRFLQENYILHFRKKM
ncbi:MAG: methyltransferase domain-containing protein [Planctomycetes bacterium]|nr:methyltransferase domain-containing protein [Planctomycetota bacterium]